ncbi:MAG: hypothetical protein J3Q66DRAFT_416891 [Benniella sp.]|nr:MAG: hypothetical protein J3Q66DRAFT_416891 [Benniella sp.]
MKVTSVVLTLSAIVALAQVTALPLLPQEPVLILRNLGQDIEQIASGAESLLASTPLFKRELGELLGDVGDIANENADLDKTVNDTIALLKELLGKLTGLSANNLVVFGPSVITASASERLLSSRIPRACEQCLDNDPSVGAPSTPTTLTQTPGAILMTVSTPGTRLFSHRRNNTASGMKDLQKNHVVGTDQENGQALEPYVPKTNNEALVDL